MSVMRSVLVRRAGVQLRCSSTLMEPYPPQRKAEGVARATVPFDAPLPSLGARQQLTHDGGLAERVGHAVGAVAIEEFEFHGLVASSRPW